MSQELIQKSIQKEAKTVIAAYKYFSKFSPNLVHECPYQVRVKRKKLEIN